MLAKKKDVEKGDIVKIRVGAERDYLIQYNNLLAVVIGDDSIDADYKMLVPLSSSPHFRQVEFRWTVDELHPVNLHTLPTKVTPTSAKQESPAKAVSKGAALVHGARAGSYGDPVENFTRIAGLWSAAFGWDVDPLQVAHAMILVKVSRDQYQHKADNLDDIEGYVECARLIARSDDSTD